LVGFFLKELKKRKKYHQCAFEKFASSNFFLLKQIIVLQFKKKFVKMKSIKDKY